MNGFCFENDIVEYRIRHKFAYYQNYLLLTLVGQNPKLHLNVYFSAQIKIVFKAA
jgi:hypothetical protein